MSVRNLLGEVYCICGSLYVATCPLEGSMSYFQNYIFPPPKTAQEEARVIADHLGYHMSKDLSNISSLLDYALSYAHRKGESIRQGFRDMLENDDKIREYIISRLETVTFPLNVDYKLITNELLYLNGDFKKTNIALQCWYLHKLYGLLQFFPLEDAKFFKDKLYATYKGCTKEVKNFIEWANGVNYSPGDLPNMLIPPLMTMVYEYLSAPSLASVKEELLRLI